MLEQVQRHPKIRQLPEREVVDLLGEESVFGVRVRHTATGEEQTLPVQGVFLAIGHHPNTDLFQGTLHLDPAGYIIPSAKTMTTVPGIFAAVIPIIARRLPQQLMAHERPLMCASGWNGNLVRIPCSRKRRIRRGSLLFVASNNVALDNDKQMMYTHRSSVAFDNDKHKGEAT